MFTHLHQFLEPKFTPLPHAGAVERDLLRTHPASTLSDATRAQQGAKVTGTVQVS
jgi:hypothetical protein